MCATLATAGATAGLLGPIQGCVRRHLEIARDRRHGSTHRAYELIQRVPDGRPRSERFVDAKAYRARLTSFVRSESRSLSIDELASLLDS